MRKLETVLISVLSQIDRGGTGAEETLPLAFGLARGSGKNGIERTALLADICLEYIFTQALDGDGRVVFERHENRILDADAERVSPHSRGSGIVSARRDRWNEPDDKHAHGRETGGFPAMFRYDIRGGILAHDFTEFSFEKTAVRKSNRRPE